MPLCQQARQERLQTLNYSSKLQLQPLCPPFAGMAELADAADSKTDLSFAHESAPSRKYAKTGAFTHVDAPRISRQPASIRTKAQPEGAPKRHPNVEAHFDAPPVE